MVEQWVKDIVEDIHGRDHLEVGMVTTHPDGRTVRIVDGQFWGTYGVSNFWYWVPVLEDGSEGPQEHGYGWL